MSITVKVYSTESDPDSYRYRTPRVPKELKQYVRYISDGSDITVVLGIEPEHYDTIVKMIERKKLQNQFDLLCSLANVKARGYEVFFDDYCYVMLWMGMDKRGNCYSIDHLEEYFFIKDCIEDGELFQIRKISTYADNVQRLFYKNKKLVGQYEAYISRQKLSIEK